MIVKIKGSLFGGPHNKGSKILGSILGSPYFGKLPFINTVITVIILTNNKYFTSFHITGMIVTNTISQGKIRLVWLNPSKSSKSLWNLGVRGHSEMRTSSGKKP